MLFSDQKIPDNVTEFNQILLIFIKELSNIVDISVNKFEMIMQYNGLLPMEYFIEHVFPLKNEIENNKLTSKSLSELGNFMSIENLPSIYDNLDNTSKNNILKYLKILLHMCEKQSMSS